VKQAKFVYDLKNGNRPLQYNKRKSTMAMRFL
jgi:hypothetical protein